MEQGTLPVTGVVKKELGRAFQLTCPRLSFLSLSPVFLAGRPFPEAE